MTNWYVTIGPDSETSSGFWRFLANPKSMTKEEQLQHILNLHGQFLTFQNSFYLSKEGTLDPRIPESLYQVIIGLKDQPGFLQFWNSRKSIFFKEYRQYVDEILKSSESVSKGIYSSNKSEK